MKKLIFMALVASATAMYQPAQAQVSLQVNIGSQPNWGPRGYDYVDYYYLPEIESYYYVPTRQFVYLERNRWVHRKSLPAKYRHYNLHQGRKIVINKPHPYLQHQYYQTNNVRWNNGYDKRFDKKHKNDRYDHHGKSKHHDRGRRG